MDILKAAVAITESDDVIDWPSTENTLVVNDVPITSLVEEGELELMMSEYPNIGTFQ